ncbi:site-2 protease family protein [Halospeciosus flavus]|uniref:Site-2 protease family protein n=1 Tax=Halospeciosus flavus TaxID=3032283 RepID=A0ABD5Z854_9EURY|nr:site-2 protease family protein [Halospeciosus flavus]
MSADIPDDAPAPRSFASVFDVYEVRREDEEVLYFGDPRAGQERLVRTVWPLFRERGYEVSLDRRMGELVLVAEPLDLGVDGVPWTNVLLFGLTVLSTLFAGAGWYYVQDLTSPAIVQALPFTLAVLGVLGVHEMGHYVASRYYGVRASLPYFIPVPTLIGTMGAIIKMRGQMPDRKALFDIGVAGPLAGLAATLVVTVVGLKLPPVTVPEWVLNAPPEQTMEIVFHYPILLKGIAWLLGEPLRYPNDPSLVVNPVVIGAWVGMFVTFLNLIPVGQLDGGHMLRAMVGETHERFAPVVPGLLFALAGYVYYVLDAGNAATLWVVWGLIAVFLVNAGSVRPVDDSPLDRKRVAVGVFTFLLGVLAFVPVPIEIIV